MTSGRQRIDVASVNALGDRKSQEDCEAHFLLPPQGSGEGRLLVVLADGMGGHAAGEVASRLAVDAFFSTAKDNRRESSEDILALGMRIAGETVMDAARADHALSEMGTTLVAVIVEFEGDGPVLRWISIGDSPLWRIDAQGVATRLNADHSLAGQLDADIRAGLITAEDAKDDPRRAKSNVLIHALTADTFDFDHAEFQRDAFALTPGDVVIVASDGIETLSEPQLGALARDAKADGAAVAAKAILKAVLGAKAKHQDNVTIAVVQV